MHSVSVGRVDLDRLLQLLGEHRGRLNICASLGCSSSYLFSLDETYNVLRNIDAVSLYADSTLLEFIELFILFIYSFFFFFFAKCTHLGKGYHT